ncbi:MAG: OmpA family protein [Treponema sp.]|jgi:outer membrane protein OmpA-like peptidoglycan-associated protein|nr:OmpA family protein [Treponema sp.]
MFKNKKCLFFSLLPLFCLFPLAAQDFQYKHHEGDKYRIISTVNEDVYIDRRLNHRAEILNRIAVEIVSVSGGKGKHKAVFQTSERGVMAANAMAANAGRSFQWSREYDSEFERDGLGRITIDKKYYMPVVRDVPVFPGREIKPGEKWSYEGHEVHDFSESFGIREPYRIPFTANYVFLGERTWKERSCPAFSVNYRINIKPQAVGGKIWPVKITGESDQIVYWDNVMGQPVAYTENFRYIFELSNGRVFEYRGKAEAEVVESERMDKEKIAGDIADEIRRLDIPEVSVRVVDEGITISLDDIQFHPDSAVMLPGENEKLDKIVDILRRYQERDIMVSGHTALAGTEEGRRKLSADRASVVADYLIGKKARTPDRVVVRGFGSDRPVADNRTEEGRRKNRRVEITILEN